MKILATAENRGPVNSLISPIKELKARGHEVTIYATGNKNEAAGFSGLDYQRIDPGPKDYDKLVKGYAVVLTGFSGPERDGRFIRAAQRAKIPTIAMQDRNGDYESCLGDNPAHLPSVIALVSKEAIERVQKELNPEMREEIIKRSKVVGWTVFDHYALMHNKFGEKEKKSLLSGLNLDAPVYFHATQIIHPESLYMQRSFRPRKEKEEMFDYELKITKKVFQMARDLNLRLTVKPHPGEEFRINYTKELAEKFDIQYIPSRSCNTQQLIMAADAVTCGKSALVNEATLLDRNVGGLFPGLGYDDINAFPPISLAAIPYTQTWEGIEDVLKTVTSSDEETNKRLSEARKRFSVDGKASKRLADLVENLG